MKNTINNLYLEFLWTYCNKNNLILYTVKDFYYFNVINKDSVYKLSGHGSSNYIKNEYHRYGINNNSITSLEQLVELSKDQKKWFVNGLSDFYQLIVDFYLTLPLKSKTKIGLLLNKFKQDSRLDIYQVNKLLITKASFADFKIWWSNIPHSFSRVSVYNSDLSNVISFLDNHVAPNRVDELLVDFLIRKKELINKNEKTSLLIKELLINRYKNKINDLNKFNQLPFIEDYLKRKENYLENPFIKESIYLEIDINKLKAYASLANWTTHTYNRWLNVLFKVIWKENKEIEKIRSYNEKIEGKSFLSIHVNKVNKTGLSKRRLEEIIKDFFNFIVKNNPKSHCAYKDIEDYINKWYLAVKLNAELNKNKKNSFHKI